MAGGMPWVKIYTEILDDPKIAKVSDAAKWRFIQLILVAAECDAGGAFVVGDEIMTTEEIAWRLRMDTETLEKDIKFLLAAGILSMDGKILEIPKFADRQGPTQKEKRETWKIRQQNRRERVTRDSRECHALEKSREEKSREDVDATTIDDIPDGDLMEYEIAFQKKTKLVNFTPLTAVKAFGQIKQAGATVQDMLNAIDEINGKYPITSPHSVITPSIVAMNKRIGSATVKTKVENYIDYDELGNEIQKTRVVNVS